MEWQCMVEDQRVWRLPMRPLDESYEIIRLAIWDLLTARFHPAPHTQSVDGGMSFMLALGSQSRVRFTLLRLPPEIVKLRMYMFMQADPVRLMLEKQRLQSSALAREPLTLIFAAAVQSAMRLLGETSPDTGNPPPPRRDEDILSWIDWRYIYRPDLSSKALASMMGVSPGHLRNTASKYGYSLDIHELPLPRKVMTKDDSTSPSMLDTHSL